MSAHTRWSSRWQSKTPRAQISRSAVLVIAVFTAVGGSVSWSETDLPDTAIASGIAQPSVVLDGRLPDDDDDGATNVLDNCLSLANPLQRDTDNDGYGNMCDADFNNSGMVNTIDLGYMRSVFFSDDPDGDLNGDGRVNYGDLGLMKLGFFAPPGPTGFCTTGNCDGPLPAYFALAIPGSANSFIVEVQDDQLAQHFRAVLAEGEQTYVVLEAVLAGGIVDYNPDWPGLIMDPDSLAFREGPEGEPWEWPECFNFTASDFNMGTWPVPLCFMPWLIQGEVPGPAFPAVRKHEPV